MTAHVLTDAQGNVVSIGTVVANPLPAGLTDNTISDADFAAIVNGLKRWSNGSVVDTGKATREANNTDLMGKLAALITEAAQAQALLQAQRNTTDLAAGTLTAAQLSSAARQLQAAVKEQAMLQQQHMKRTVAIARLVAGSLDSTADT